MNKTHYLIALLSLLLAAGGLCSCIKEDLSDCRFPVQLAITYTMHNTRTPDGTEYSDRFAEQVHKIDVFAFDAETGLLQTHITDDKIRPQAGQTYTRSIELPEGNYRFVVWGNRNDAETAFAEQGNISTARLSLKQLQRAQQEVALLQDSLFCGISTQTVCVKEKQDPRQLQTATVDLTKDRNDVRVVVRWVEQGKNEPDYCTETEHAAKTKAMIIDSNGTYDFMNAIAADNEITYLPSRFGTQYDKVFHGEETAQNVYPWKVPYFYVADFSELRLMKDNIQARLVISQDGKTIYTNGLIELISKSDQYKTQEALDREDHYLIEVVLRCDQPWSVICIYINGWRFVPRDIDLE